MINNIDSARLKEEQDEYDMQYKSYFGHESLELRPQAESHSHHSLTVNKTLNKAIIKLHEASAEKPPLPSRNMETPVKCNTEASPSSLPLIENRSPEAPSNMNDITGGRYMIESTAAKNQRALEYIMYR